MALSSQNKAPLFDPLRKKELISKQEERVRQALLKHMIENLKFPKERLLVERTLARLPHLENQKDLPNRRVDILCYEKEGNDFSSLLVIECKHAMVDPAAFHQLFGYNHFLGAPFLAVVSMDSILFRYKSEKEFAFLNYLPSYGDLLRAKNENKPFAS